MTRRAESTGVSPSTMAVLMLSVFTVSLGFGIVLPLLPYAIERLLGIGGDPTQVSRSTGLLTGLYTLSIFLFAPAWGRLSDRYGRRSILLIGLIGFGATMGIFAFIENLPAIYAERFLSGMFAAAVTPVALATIGDLVATEESRARRLTLVSLAGISGFLFGPMLGVFIARVAANLLPSVTAAESLGLPLAGTAFLALFVALATALTVPATKGGDPAPNRNQSVSAVAAWLVPKLLALTFIVAAGVGVFEVGLALRGKQELGLTQYQIAVMFTTCSLVMFVAQAIVFSPWVEPATTRWFIAPALAVLAGGLFLVPRASDFTLMLAVIGAVAASAGVLSPILTYWISSKAGRTQGAQLGKQTSAASLGAAVGAAAGGLLYEVAWLPDASFLLVTAITMLGILLSLDLPNRLMTRTFGADTDDTDMDDRAKRARQCGRILQHACQTSNSTDHRAQNIASQSRLRGNFMLGPIGKVARKARMLLVIPLLSLLVTGCGFNNIPTYEEQAKAKWSDVLNQYQRRSDLIPNLVETVKGFAKQESAVLEAVTAARAQATSIQVNASTITDPDVFKKFQEAQAQLSGSLGRLLAISESYPDLKSNQNFLALQSQLEGTENRIAVARRDYIEAVRLYNTELRTLPGRIWASIFYTSNKPMEEFTVADSVKQTPQVKF
jgi:predicted MFS family arabinose efflux permease